MNTYESMEELIGNTPMLHINHWEAANDAGANVYAKLEYLNPAGSAKDRVARQMIDDAEEAGLLKPKAVIIEPTSGNTGIGLCAIAAVRGYKCIIVMPDTMSQERITLMKAYGAQVVLTPGAEGMAGSIAKAEELAANTPNSYIPGQFVNPSNSKAHVGTTGPEIYRDMDGLVDIFVAGVGTGGTITGCGEYLKSQNPLVKVVAVEPASSQVLAKGVAGSHGIQGIGANFVPEVLHRDVLDEIIPITDEDAINQTRAFAIEEGILVGISSGAVLHAAAILAKRPENAGKNIVVLLPDTGDRYLSSSVYADL